jgi:hypothetical protein
MWKVHDSGEDERGLCSTSLLFGQTIKKGSPQAAFLVER